MKSKTDDLEDILREIRSIVKKYKVTKHEMFMAMEVQDLRDDLAVLRFQLADIGSELYGWKIESAAKYDNDRLKKEEELELDLLEQKKKDSKITNIADRAKRGAKLAVSPDEMNECDKINRQAINLYQYAIPDVLHAMSSRIAILVRVSNEPERTKQDYYPKEGNDGFENSWGDVEKRVIDSVDSML